MRILFIHRSVGQQLIDSVDLRTRATAYEFYDLNANDGILTDAEGQKISAPVALPNSNTTPSDLAAFFASALVKGPESDFLDGFDVLTFKSCYSANNFATDGSLDDAKECYLGSIAQYIEMNDSKQFVLSSPPPRKPPLFTFGSKSRRAREFSEFLNDFAKARARVTYFDLFGLLADSGGGLRRSYRRQLPWDQHPNMAGAAAGGAALCEHLEALAKSP